MEAEHSGLSCGGAAQHLCTLTQLLTYPTLLLLLPRAGPRMPKEPWTGRMLHRALTSASLGPTSLHTWDAPQVLDNESWRGGQPLPFLCHPLKQNVGEPHLSPTTTGCGYRNQGPLQAGLAGIPVPHPQPNPHQQWQWRRDKARRLRLGPGWKPAWNCQRRLQCQQGAEGKYSLPPGLGP